MLLLSNPTYEAWAPFKWSRANAEFKASATDCIIKRFGLEEKEKDYSDAERTKDFFYWLIHGNNPETGASFQPTELIGEALLLVVAGADTTSTTLSGVFFYLLENPRILKKLQKEVREAFGNVEEITWSGGKLNDLVYLRACIDESMRMSPPVPTLLDRLVLPGGATVDKTFVPGGITVGVPIYTLQHNPRYHERPTEYVPERWIEGSTSAETGFKSAVTESTVETAKSAFVPFSTGTRGCAGKNLAYMELLTAVARVMFLFDIRKPQNQTASGKHPVNALDRAGFRTANKREYQIEDIFVAKRDSVMVEFHRR